MDNPIKMDNLGGKPTIYGNTPYNPHVSPRMIRPHLTTGRPPDTTIDHLVDSMRLQGREANESILRQAQMVVVG